MRVRKKYGIIVVIIFVMIWSISTIYRSMLKSQRKYLVINSKENITTRILKDEERSYYLESLDSIDIVQNGKRIPLSSALLQRKITLEELLTDAFQKTEDNNGVMYSYNTFSIYVCQKIYEDHVKPNKDVIIGPKNFQIDFTKHCKNQ